MNYVEVCNTGMHVGSSTVSDVHFRHFFKFMACIASWVEMCNNFFLSPIIGNIIELLATLKIFTSMK